MDTDESSAAFSTLSTWLTLGITGLSVFMSWLLADAKAKARCDFTDAQVATMIEKHDELEAAHNDLQVKVARGEQNYQAVVESLMRLERDKASRDTVIAVQQDLGRLHTQMDLRFDRLERLMKT